MLLLPVFQFGKEERGFLGSDWVEKRSAGVWEEEKEEDALVGSEVYCQRVGGRGGHNMVLHIESEEAVWA